MIIRQLKPHRIATDDEALQHEALRIAASALDHEADRLHSVWPSSAMVERLRTFAESMRELLARLTGQ